MQFIGLSADHESCAFRERNIILRVSHLHVLCLKVPIHHETLHVTFGLHLTTQRHRTATFSFFFLPLPWSPCTIQSRGLFGYFLYDINLGATHTTILCTRGVEIPIYLVNRAMDSIRRHVVLFKTVTVLTSDLKSEFLCQSSPYCAEPTDSPESPCTPGISPTPSNTTYHPYCQSPGALTEYLKQKLRHQWAKCLGHSPSTQVKQNVPLKRNIAWRGHHWKDMSGT